MDRVEEIEAARIRALDQARWDDRMDRDSAAGKLDFLFIAPERLRVQGFPEMLAKRKLNLLPHHSPCAKDVRRAFERAQEEEKKR